MWKANLNQQIKKIIQISRIPLFLAFWNSLFHVLTLSLLTYWSLTSPKISPLSRMGTLNQFWNENQILFAALATFGATLFFQNALATTLRSIRLYHKVILVNLIRGLSFAILLLGGLVIFDHFEFLGFSAQFNLNFLSAYTWLLRALLVVLFTGSVEFLIRIVLKDELSTHCSPFTSTLIQWLTFLLLYGIWFDSRPLELVTLSLFFFLFRNFWSSVGFMCSFFVVLHAFFGFAFFGTEFVGMLQLKSLYSEGVILEHPSLMITLVFLVSAVHLSRQFMLKSKDQNSVH